MKKISKLMITLTAAVAVAAAVPGVAYAGTVHHASAAVTTSGVSSFRHGICQNDENCQYGGSCIYHGYVSKVNVPTGSIETGSAEPGNAGCYQDGVCINGGACDLEGVCQSGGACYQVLDNNGTDSGYSSSDGNQTAAGYHHQENYRSGHHSSQGGHRSGRHH